MRKKGELDMKKRELLVRLSLLVVAMLLATALPASADPTPPANIENETLDETAAHITDSLTRLDLEVHDGYFQMWGADECLPTYELMGSCFFNNPAAPYILPVLPYWPEEFIDPATKWVFGETREGYGTTYRFDPHEAIVIFGYLPPEAHYFGLQSYTFTHKGKYETDNETYAFLSSLGTEDVFFHNVPLNPKRIGYMNSLSDSINNVVIERQSGSTWEQFRYFIITPDGHLEREIRQTLVALGVNDSDIFTEGIPENVRLGLNKNADDFMSAFRYSMPFDGGDAGSPSDAWRHSPTLRLLRVRDTSPGYPKEPFPAWGPDSPEPRTGVSEAYLSEDLTMLVHAVAKAWDQACADPACTGRYGTFGDLQSAPMNVLGPKCAEIGMDCAGDAQDASYGFYPGAYFDDGEVWAVIGTLGTKTGNATYVGVGVNNFHLRLGAKNVDYKKLEGSASAALYPDFQGNPDNLDKLFVYYFARDCDDIEPWTHGYCAEVEDTPLVLPAGDRGAFTERDYIAPGTQRGPDSTKLLPSRALKLARP
jgi:hypothetical protein